MTPSSGPWPCPTCPVKGASYCKTIAPDDMLVAKLRINDIKLTSSTAEARRTVFRPGKSSDDIHILCEGWAFTYFRLPDGRRQIFSFLLPGDIFSSRMIFGKEEYVSVASVTEVRYSRINSADLRREIVKNPELLKNAAKACAGADQHYLETVVDLGQRSAEERIANFLMRLTERLDAVEANDKGGPYPFPIRQSEIADAVGLTPVHVSRVMTRFRKEELIDSIWGELVIKDRHELNRRASLN